MAEKELKVLNKYHFEKQLSKMKAEFGSIAKGNEEEFLDELLSIETVLLRFYKKHTDITGNDALNALRICLFKTASYMSDTVYDYSSLVDSRTQELGDLLADVFIPPKTKSVIQTSEELRNYFSVYIRCLIKIGSSVEFWEKEFGFGGYFKFLNGQMGKVIK